LRFAKLSQFLIVLPPLIRVDEVLMGLIDLFELLLGVTQHGRRQPLPNILWYLVWMVLMCKTTVGVLNLLLGRRLRNPKDIVIRY
jgi:hypothetical protein